MRNSPHFGFAGQPAGLTLGSFPWGAKKPDRKIWSFCSPVGRAHSASSKVVQSPRRGQPFLSDEELTALRLRRQPTGLTLGSFPWGAKKPDRKIWSFCSPVGRAHSASSKVVQSPRRGQPFLSDEELTALRLRRQPAGLTLGSFPWGAKKPDRKIWSFCMCRASRKRGKSCLLDRMRFFQYSLR